MPVIDEAKIRRLHPVEEPAPVPPAPQPDGAEREEQPAAAPTPKALLCEPAEISSEITPICQAIARARGRPLFMLVASNVNEVTCREVHGWRAELRGARSFDVLIESPGGVLSSCYQIGRMFSRASDDWEALVPSYAVSGATLICLGSSRIVMSETAQLGPLDPQVISRREEKFFAAERQSPLEAFQAVRYLREFALASLDASMQYLLAHGVAAKPAIDTACELALGLVAPSLGRLDPYDLGAFALDSALAREYCQRLGAPKDGNRKTQRTVPYQALVERYPVHEFVIDLEEARFLRFNVEEPTAEVDELFEQLKVHLDEVESCIGLLTEGEVTP